MSVKGERKNKTYIGYTPKWRLRFVQDSWHRCTCISHNRP